MTKEAQASSRTILDCLNWKKNPSSIWLVAGPLIAVGIILNVIQGVLLCIKNHTLIPAYILVGFSVLAYFALTPPIRSLRALDRKGQDRTPAGGSRGPSGP